jgi:restriction system protein
MPRYWIIAPHESDPPQLFDKVWQYDLANNLISIGWVQLGDASSLSLTEIAEKVASTYPKRRKGLVAKMIWSFYHKISVGDFIIARCGQKELVAIGNVTKAAIYSPGKNPFIEHPNFLAVSWQQEPRNKVFQDVRFPRFTLAEVSEDKFHGLQKDAIVDSDASEPQDEIEDRIAFNLEKYLQDFMVGNFDSIFKGKIKIYQDPDGERSDGPQYVTDDAGTIDILAIEPQTNAFVVVELKRGRASDKVVGQIQRYMGWVKQNLCDDGQIVKGLIICHNHDPKLSYALEMTQNISVQYYTYDFQLSDTPHQP